MNKEVTEVVSGNRSLTVSGDTVTTYTSSRTILLDNNLKETITGKLNYIISGEMAFNVNSDFTISSAKTIELATNTTGGYVHITNTNNGALVSENRALVVNGGVNNQKDMFIGGNITVAGNLNVLDNYGKTSLHTEIVNIHDPLMTIGANQIADASFSGLLSRSYLDTTQKFSGIVRNTSNTYALLNNINTATNDNTEYSNTDLTNTFSNSLVDKHSSIFANKITSLEPNINTNGELYVAKNIFVGIDNKIEVLQDKLQAGWKLLDALVDTGACGSKSQARKLVVSGGAYVNNERVSDPDFILNRQQLASSSYLVLRTGKKNYRLIKVT